MNLSRPLPPRSGLMTLAVGFNPRLRIGRYFPRRVATVEPINEGKNLVTTSLFRRVAA
jgi:hypothetical protein